MIRVVHLFGRLDKGGAELRTIDSLKYFNENYRFIFLSLSGEKGYLDNVVKEMGHEVFHIKLKSFSFPYKFLKFLRNEKIDIVHSHIFYSSAIIVSLTKIFTNKKIISHFRTSGRGEVNKLKLIRNIIFRKIINNFSDSIIFVSKSTKLKAFKNVDNTKSQVIYNGFDEKKDLKLHRTKITHVGRFNEAKNQMFLLDVARGLKNSSTIDFIGKNDTKYGREFNRILSKYNIENVKIMGISNHVDEILQESKLFLFPSIREGLPGALIEAALNNCYIIASDIPENREVEEFFPHQIKILPLDSNLWIKEINNILEKGECLNLEQNNIFSYDSYVYKLEKIYNKLIIKENI